MRSQLVRRGFKILVRGYHQYEATVGTNLHRHKEAIHFYTVLASRPAYYVGKLKTVEVEDASSSVRKFLEASAHELGRDTVTDIVREAPGFSSTTVKALLLKIHSWMPVGDAERDESLRRHIRNVKWALIERSQELVESEQSLELEFTLADLLLRTTGLRPFARTILPRQSTALKYLTEADFIQHLFFSISIRTLQPATRKAVPIFVENVMDKLDLEEVALVCFALYSTQYALSNTDHWLKIVGVLERHKGPISDECMGVLAKYLRYLSPMRFRDGAAVERFMAVASRRRAEWSLSTHLRIAKAGTQAQIGNEDLVRSSVHKLMQQLGTCRIKDLATCLFTNAYFDTKIDRKDAEAIMERLRNEDVEPVFHPSLIQATFSLAVLGYYDEELIIKSLDRSLVDLTSTHRRMGFDTYALFILCDIMFPHLLKDKILLTKEDMRPVIEHNDKMEELARRFALELKGVKEILEERFHVQPRVERTLDLFPQKDLRIGDKLVIVLHTIRFYNRGGKLRGFRRFHVDLLKAAKYDVVELDRDFFEMTCTRRTQHLQKALSGYLT